MPERRRAVAEQPAISGGIEKSVDVIDPQTLYPAGLDQFEHEPMRLAEHLGILDA